MDAIKGEAKAEAEVAAPSSAVQESGEKPAADPVEREPVALAAKSEVDGGDAPEKPAESTADAVPPPAAAEAPKEPDAGPKVAAATDKPAEPPAAQSSFAAFAQKLPEIVKEVGHDEMWGVKLSEASVTEPSVPVSIVLQKYLNANDGDLDKGVEQLKAALKFRKEKKPAELLGKTFNASKFGDLGAVTVYPVKDKPVAEIFTWNLYGNVKDRLDQVFVPLDEFLDYRIALQEVAVQELHLATATEPITATHDPYKITQVHDYKNISFLRQNANVKAASTEVIKQFSTAYPELLKEKFFVNVPAVMGWMYALIKLFVAPKTAKKFHPMSNGANLAAEYVGSDLDGKLLPKEYGGQAGAGDGTFKDVSGRVDKLAFA